MSLPVECKGGDFRKAMLPWIAEIVSLTLIIQITPTVLRERFCFEHNMETDQLK